MPNPNDGSRASTSGLPDRAVETAAEDFLNRTAFTNALADQVLNAPAGQTLRIGVYGGWGEGKTSVLELMRGRLEANGEVCIWIIPWTSKTAEEVLDQLISQLTAKLGIDASTLKHAQSHALLALTGKELAEEASFWSRAAARLAGGAIQRHFGEKVVVETAKFWSEVKNKLGKHRVIVFIDDIDRVRPELVPELLLTLRETLDQPNFFYVIALAPDVVQRGLRMVHRGWGSATDFLEKIIEYPRHLPRPTDHDIDHFIERSIEALGDVLNAAVLRSLVPLLPRNPRKLKLYLRILGSLHGLLSRFDPGELDAAVFHLLLLLRCEFPEETRLMMADANVVEDLRLGYMHDRRRERSDAAKHQQPAPISPAMAYAPISKSALMRFWQLYDAVRNRDLLLQGRYKIDELYALPDEPPAITWRELNAFLIVLQECQEAQRPAVIKEWLGGTENTLQTRRLDAAFHLFIEMRQASLAQAADARLDADRIRLCLEASLLGEALRCLIVDLGAFSAGMLSIDAWKSLLEHTQRWLHFGKLKEYVELRKSEADLLLASIDVMAPPLRGEALELVGVLSNSAQATGPDLLINRLRGSLETWATGSILDAFTSPDALDALLVGTRNITMQSILMLPSSPLYTNSDRRQALLSLAAQASSSSVVQRNFAEFAGRILYEAVEGGKFAREDVRKLLSDQQLIGAIWGAAIATPLNARVAGGMRLRRNRLIAEGVMTERQINKRLPLPQWWIVLEDTFFE